MIEYPGKQLVKGSWYERINDVEILFKVIDLDIQKVEISSKKF